MKNFYREDHEAHRGLVSEFSPLLVVSFVAWLKYRYLGFLNNRNILQALNMPEKAKSEFAVITIILSAIGSEEKACACKNSKVFEFAHLKISK